MRINRAFGQLLALLDVIAFENDHVLSNRDQMLFLNTGLLILNDDTALATDARAEINDPIDLRNLRSILGPPRFEQLRHSRQPAGDIFGLRSLARSLRHQSAGN